MKAVFTFLLVFSALAGYSQYWFGPTGGAQYTDFIYQDSRYKSDSFQINGDIRWHAGASFVYQASDKYSIHTELLFERVHKLVTEKIDPNIRVYSKTRFNYLALPLSLRFNFGGEPTHFYVSGGPKISLWLGGTGTLDLDELDEAYTRDAINYNIVFKENTDSQESVRAVTDANRVQFALQLGTGVFFDLYFGGRLSLDMRYTFGHSNIALNNSPDFNGWATYKENFKFRNNMLSLSLAYLFEYDAKEQAKGMSTNKESNKVRKKK